MARRITLWSVLFATLFCARVATAQQSTGAKPSTKPGGSITGRVINSAGEPVDGALVFATMFGSSSRRKTATTDSHGEFKLEGLDPGLYSASAGMPGYVFSARPNSGDAPNYLHVGDSVTFTLIRGGVITGAVTGPNGPVVGVGVFATRVKDADGKKLFTAVPSGQERRTDDRGMFRIYGLAPGAYLLTATRPWIGIASPSAYDSDVPTFYPSATRDTATEIIVREGEEITADIQYRGEPGHTISGKIARAFVDPMQFNQATQISLTDLRDRRLLASGPAVSLDGSSFALNGVPDGEYELYARQYLPTAASDLRSQAQRIKVQGADVTGLNLNLAPLASIAGRLIFEPDAKANCGKDKDIVAVETLVYARRFEPQPKRAEAKSADTDMPLTAVNASALTVGESKGAFLFRNLSGGSYRIDPRLTASGWYVRSIAVGPTPAKPNGPNIARDGVAVRSGERLNGVTVTIAEGAALLRGKLTLTESQTAAMRAYLVPAEPQDADNIYRFYEAGVEKDGNFTLDNLAPGSYWIVASPAEQTDLGTTRLIRQDDVLRAKVRQAAEVSKKAVTLKPCAQMTQFEFAATR